MPPSECSRRSTTWYVGSAASNPTWHVGSEPQARERWFPGYPRTQYLEDHADRDGGKTGMQLPNRWLLELARPRAGTLPALPDGMAKPKLKWFREGYDPHEDLYLIPVDQERNADGDLNTDAAVAWVKIAYDRTRFYSGRGGEGTSRPDSYVAFVQDPRPGRQHRGIVITDGADAVAHIGGLFSDKADSAFRTLRAAKQAIRAALAKQSLVEGKGQVVAKAEPATVTTTTTTTAEVP